MRWSRGWAFAAAAALVTIAPVPMVTGCSSSESMGNAPPVVTEAPTDGGTPIRRPLGDASFSSITTDGGEDGGGDESGADARAGTLTDAQIVAVLDLFDIAFDEDSTMMIVPEGTGATATQPTSNAKVARLANDLLAAHAAYADERRALVAANGIGSSPSSLSTELSSTFLANIVALRAAGDGARDAVYLRIVLAYQASEIKTVDDQLAPSASNGALRAYLTKLRGNLQLDFNETLSVASDLGIR